MLKFSTPGNLSLCLGEAYEYLRPGLENLIGFTASIERFRGVKAPAAKSAWEADGSLLIRLPGPRAELGNFFLRIPALAAEDDHCRRVAARFVGTCNRIARQAKKSWDIKAQLIREEQFLWDDLTLAQFYGGNQKYNVLDLIGTGREASIFRYEGAPVRLGLLSTWNWYQLKPKLKERGWVVSEFPSPFDLRTRLSADKASHLLTDGIRSFYVVNSAGAAVAWISVNSSAEPVVPSTWETVPVAYHHIDGMLIGRDLVISLNRHGEMNLFARHEALKWNRTGWHRLTGPPISDFLLPYAETNVARRVVKAAVRLSESRRGALFIFVKDAAATPPLASRGLAKRFFGPGLFSIADIDLETICQLAGVDGAVLVSASGLIVDIGAIVRLPDEQAKAAQGARSAAAAFASVGTAGVKVSEDGPISIFRDGIEVRRAG